MEKPDLSKIENPTTNKFLELKPRLDVEFQKVIDGIVERIKEDFSLNSLEPDDPIIVDAIREETTRFIKLNDLERMELVMNNFPSHCGFWWSGKSYRGDTEERKLIDDLLNTIKEKGYGSMSIEFLRKLDDTTKLTIFFNVFCGMLDKGYAPLVLT